MMREPSGQSDATVTPPRPRAVLLDIGGTILRENAYDIAAGVRALAPDVDVGRMAGELQREIDFVHQTDSTEFTLARWLGEKRGCFRKAGSVADLELDFFRGAVTLSPMPGAREGMRALVDLGLVIGCLSNTVFSGHVLLEELSHHGLAESLRCVVSSADISIRKPAPEVFGSALSALGTKASETWFVGDSWRSDIEGAAAAGLFPVWLSQEGRRSTRGPAHFRAPSWCAISRLAAGALGRTSLR